MARRVEPQPIPVDRFLLDCFDLVLGDDEVAFLLALDDRPTTRAEALTRSGLPPERAQALLDALLRKEVLAPHSDPASGLIDLTPFMPGWFETQLADGGESDHHREFARRIDRLFASWRDQNTLPARWAVNAYYRLRTRPFQTIAQGPAPRRVCVQVDQVVSSEPSEIHPTRSVAALVSRHAGAIVLMHCFCRQWRKLVDEPCRFHLPAETCLVLGASATSAVARGLGRAIDVRTALDLLHRAQEAGAIHTVFHDRDDAAREATAICSCCWDCCGVFGSYNRGAAALHFRCSFRAEVVEGSCDGCGTCVRYCPVQAAVVREGTLSLDPDRCIGCGQCAFQCPREAVELTPCDRQVLLGMQPLSRVRLTSG